MRVAVVTETAAAAAVDERWCCIRDEREVESAFARSLFDRAEDILIGGASTAPPTRESPITPLLLLVLVLPPSCAKDALVDVCDGPVLEERRRPARGGTSTATTGLAILLLRLLTLLAASLCNTEPLPLPLAWTPMPVLPVDVERARLWGTDPMELSMVRSSPDGSSARPLLPLISSGLLLLLG